MSAIFNYMNRQANNSFIAAVDLELNKLYEIIDIQFDCAGFGSWGPRTQVTISFPIPETELFEQRIVKLPPVWLLNGSKGKTPVLHFTKI